MGKKSMAKLVRRMSEFPEDELIELAFDVANSEELSRDGERLLERIQASPGALAKFDEYLRTISEARAAFDEMTGPAEAAPTPMDDNTLAEYLDGVLSDAEREQVEAQLVGEPGALQQLIGLAELLEPGEDESSTVTFVIELAKKGLRLLSHPAEGFELIPLQPAAVLGPEKTQRVQTWTQRLGPVHVHCTLQATKDDLLGLTIKLISPARPPKGSRISLLADGKLVQSDVVPDSGELTLRNLEPATYDLDIIVPSLSVARMRFDFMNGQS